jgi:NifU-like protein involved in Fe-S cluster formation
MTESFIQDENNERLPDFVENVSLRGRCRRPTHVGEADDLFSGTIIRLELYIDDDGHALEVVYDYEDGSTLALAAVAMLVDWLRGKTLAEIGEFAASDMLTLVGIPIESFTVTNRENRRNDILTGWRALQAAIRPNRDK